MEWNQHLTNLRDALAGSYFDKRDIVRVAQEAGLKPQFLNLDGKPITVWQEVLREAQKHGIVVDIVRVALKEYPANDVLRRALTDSLTSVRGMDIEAEVNWQHVDNIGNLEALMGRQSTILPISFLELGIERSRSVARVVRTDGSTGSGFLICQNLFATCHHVIESADQATTARIEFNYQQTTAGLNRQIDTFTCNPSDGFRTSKEDDWTIVRLAGEANSVWGEIPVGPSAITREQRVMIIQHPGGGPKSIAMFHNVVTYADDRQVQYLTDTLPGSSGSPVFDKDWNLIAIHHTGGWMREPGSKETLFRNEGITINRLLAGASPLM